MQVITIYYKWINTKAKLLLSVDSNVLQVVKEISRKKSPS